MSSGLRVFNTALMSSSVAAFIKASISPEMLSDTSSSSSSSSSPSKTMPVLDVIAPLSPSSGCYFPDKEPPEYYGYTLQSCGGRNTTWQQCCDPGEDICTENGLCMFLGDVVPRTYTYRGGCVNADWSGCPQVCLDVLPDSGVQVKRCPMGKYCCSMDDHSDCCDSEHYQFSLSNHNPAAMNITGGERGSDEGKKNETNVSGGASSNNSTQVGGEGKKNGTYASGSVGSYTTTQVGDGANHTTRVDDSDDEDDSKADRATIGTAVGSALGGLAIIGGVVGMWLHLRKKRAKQEKEVIAQGETLGLPEMKEVLEMGTDSAAGQKCISETDMKDHPTVLEMDSTIVYELGV